MRQQQERDLGVAGDYLDLGVPVTWIFDPKKKKSWVYSDQGTVESRDPVLRHGRIELPIGEIFASKNFA